MIHKIFKWSTKEIIFEFECNSIKECVIEGVKQKIPLSNADLSNAILNKKNIKKLIKALRIKII